MRKIFCKIPIAIPAIISWRYWQWTISRCWLGGGGELLFHPRVATPGRTATQTHQTILVSAFSPRGESRGVRGNWELHHMRSVRWSPPGSHCVTRHLRNVRQNLRSGCHFSFIIIRGEARLRLERITPALIAGYCQIVTQLLQPFPPLLSIPFGKTI